MNSPNLRRVFLFMAIAGLVLAGTSGRAALAWNPGEASSPGTKWGTANGKPSYMPVSFNSKIDSTGGVYHHYGHIYILQHAIDILSRDGYDNWATLLHNNLAHLASGSKHADAYKGRVEIQITLEILWGLVDVHTWSIDLTCAGGCEHYHDINANDGLDLTGWSMLGDAADVLIKLITMLGPSQYTYGLVDLDIDVVPDLRAQYPSGLKLCQDHFEDAKQAWEGNFIYPERSALDSAFYELGWACHLMADLTVAQHLHGEFIGGHAGYEDAADGLGDDTSFHATSAKGIYSFSSVSGSQAVRQMGLKLANILYADSDNHDKAENGDEDARHEALKKALPLAEQYTAALMAQFLNEAGIPSTTPPLEGYIRDTTGERIPYAYVFYAPAGYTVQIEQNLTAAQLDPKQNWKGWSYIRADANGFYKLPMKKFRKYWLRPAMPGYSFKGETSYNREFGAKTIPALYTPPAVSYSKDTLGLYMTPLPKKAVMAFLPGQEDKKIMKMVKFAGTDVLVTGIRPELIKPGQVLPASRTRLASAVTRRIYEGAVKADSSSAALQTKGSTGKLPTSATVVFQVSNLVSIFDGRTLQTTAEIAAIVDKAAVKLQEARAAVQSGSPQQIAAVGDIGKPTFLALQAMLPSQTVAAPGGRTRKALSPSSAFPGNEGAALLIENGLLLTPSKSGVEIEVKPDSGTGLLSPAEASLSLKTGNSGSAWFTVQSGSHPGKLVLRYKVTKNPEALDIKAEGVVEILIQPGLDDADPAAETPITLTRPLQLEAMPFVPLAEPDRPVFRERIRIEPGLIPGLGRRRDMEPRRPPEPEPDVRRREGEKRAEAVPPREGFDLNGEWFSNIPGAFRIKQNGEEFTWEGIDLKQSGRGRITGRELEASWEGESGSGRAKGVVVEAGPEGWAFRIQWSNGTVFFRPPKGREPGIELKDEPRREEPPPPPTKKPEPPPRGEPQPPRREEPKAPPREPQPQQPQPPSQAIDISGRWTSSLRLVHHIRQEGAAFTWQAEGQSQVLKGTIDGRVLRTSWTGMPASEQVTGEIVQVSDKGRALVIRWSNGIEFRR